MDAERCYRDMTYIVNAVSELNDYIKKNDIYEMGRSMCRLSRACTDLQEKFYREAHPEVVSI